MDNIDGFGSVLQHDEGYGPRLSSYSNKYYDYNKAHEYYERTKQLKGRSSSASESGSYGAKSDISSENQNASSINDGEIEALKRERYQRYITNIQTLLSRLQLSILNLSLTDENSREAAISKIQNEIQYLRNANDRMRNIYYRNSKN